MTEFHPSTGYHWKSAESAPGTSSPTLLPSTSIIDPQNPAAAAGAVKVGTLFTTGYFFFFQEEMLCTGLAGFDAYFSCPLESQDFRVAVDRAIKNVEQRAHMQQFLLQSGAHGAGAGTGSTGAGGTSSTVKQEGGAGATQSPTGTPASRNAPKVATKRRKKSEEASTAAASMGINTSVGSASNAQGGRAGSAGGGNQPTTPATPTSTPTKRRKKTKNTDPK